MAHPLRDFVNKLTAPLTAKRYTGVLGQSIPMNPTRWGANDFLNANEISLYTNRAIAKRAEKVGEIEFYLRNKKGERIENPQGIQAQLLNLLYKPNKVFTGRQFWDLYQKYLDLTGEAYIYVERSRPELFEAKTIVGLHLLRSDLVTPHYNDDGTIERYEYNTGEKKTNYKPEEVVYIFTPDPKRPLRGVSLLKAGVNAIQTETQIATYHTNVLKNGGKVEGVFNFKTGLLTKEQLGEVKASYKKEYAEAQKAGIPLFLGGDAEYVKTGLTPDELSYLEAKKITLEDICILTGTPKAIMGSMDDVQYSNADASIRIYLRETIRPLLQTLTTALDEMLFPDDTELAFVDPTPENTEETLKKIDSGVKGYYRTINETRELAGEEAIEGGDVIMVPFNMIALDPKAAKKLAAEKRAKAAGESTHPLADPEIRNMWGRMQIKRMDAQEKKLEPIVDKYFRDQRERLIAALDPTKLRHFRKTALDELLQISIEVKIGKELFIPVLTDLLKEAGQNALDLLESSATFNAGPEIVSWLDGRADVFLNQINETTYATLKEQFAISAETGESRDKLIARIKETYDGITTARAATIARTEVHSSTQYGTIEGYKQAGLTTKIWVAVADAATRDSHLAQDGEERPMNTPFTNGLMYPGDNSGPPGEVINCRCSV